MYQTRTDPASIRDFYTYDIDAASCTEVLIDTLTGETQVRKHNYFYQMILFILIYLNEKVLRTDILYDSGQTMNGLIDIGQAEGMKYQLKQIKIFISRFSKLKKKCDSKNHNSDTAFEKLFFSSCLFRFWQFPFSFAFSS